jgi:hypothetical protein
MPSRRAYGSAPGIGGVRDRPDATLRSPVARVVHMAAVVYSWTNTRTRIGGRRPWRGR